MFTKKFLLLFIFLRLTLGLKHQKPFFMILEMLDFYDVRAVGFVLLKEAVFFPTSHSLCWLQLLIVFAPTPLLIFVICTLPLTIKYLVGRTMNIEPYNLPFTKCVLLVSSTNKLSHDRTDSYNDHTR